MMSGEGETRVAGGFPRQGAAQRIEIAPIDPAVVVEVLGIAVAVEVDARHAHAQRVADRQVDHPLDLLRIVIAVLEFAGGVETREIRSEEHTSELQSLMRISYAVFCLKKKNKHTNSSPQCSS